MNKKPKQTTPKKLTKTEYEELGRIVAAIYETGYLNKAQSFKMSFVKGMFQGFGGVIGATILVALLLWTLSFFDEVPFLGDIVNSVENTVQQNKQ